jgi:3'(2'), 5'-bisphosphate nucleotidase
MGDRRVELEAAVEAVRAASRACRTVQQRLLKPAALEKADKSPVTVADFASQAIVCASLGERLPSDSVVGEEDAAALRTSREDLRSAVVSTVRDELQRDVDAERVYEWIERGAADARGARYWTVDPIDGTKGFLRGEQYAVALGLIEDGEVVLGVLGCPNLPFEGGVGALYSAVRGEPALEYSLWDGAAPGRQISVDGITRAADARFCESVESAHSNQEQSARVAEALGIRAQPYRIDSQCKYAAVARSDASIYLRMPTRVNYFEKIWDHAAGMLVVESAGGRVSDIEGQPLDFTRGRTLEANQGVVATNGAIHDEVIEAVGRTRQ